MQKKESLLALWRELKVKKIFQFPSFSINLMWKDKKKLKSIFARHQSKVTLANGFFALELFFSFSCNFRPFHLLLQFISISIQFYFYRSLLISSLPRSFFISLNFLFFFIYPLKVVGKFLFIARLSVILLYFHYPQLVCTTFIPHSVSLAFEHINF